MALKGSEHPPTKEKRGVKRPFPFLQPLACSPHATMRWRWVSWREATGSRCCSCPWSFPRLGQEPGGSQPGEGIAAQEGLVHRGSNTQRSFSNNQTLDAASGPGRTRQYRGSGILPGDAMAPFPSCSHKPGGGKIISNRRKQSDYQHPSPVPDLLGLSAASFLRNTTAVSKRLREGWAELSLQPGQLR